MVFDHPLATRQRIDDRIDAIVEEPLDPLRILLSRSDEAELGEQLVGDQVGGPIEIPLFPGGLDLPSIPAQAADVRDVQVVLRSAGRMLWELHVAAKWERRATILGEPRAKACAVPRCSGRRQKTKTLT